MQVFITSYMIMAFLAMAVAYSGKSKASSLTDAMIISFLWPLPMAVVLAVIVGKAAAFLYTMYKDVLCQIIDS